MNEQQKQNFGLEISSVTQFRGEGSNHRNLNFVLAFVFSSTQIYSMF